MTGLEFMEKALRRNTDYCIPWPFGCFDSGYPLVAIDSSPHRAHREVCRRAHGEPPTPEHHAAHGCDNILCINKRHLRWATALENTADKRDRGRKHGPRGVEHGCAILTPEQVRAVRGDTRSQRLIGASYGVSQQTISDVKRGKLWGHVA